MYIIRNFRCFTSGKSVFTGGTHGPATAVHGLDQDADVVRVGELRNAVAEVEHMAWMVAVAVDDACDFATDDIRRAVQGAGIEIALQRHLAAHAAARFADVDAPVEADRVGAAGGDGFQLPPPLVKTMLGTRRPSRSLIRPSTMRSM